MAVNGDTGHSSRRPRRTQAERSAATRSALLAAARSLFAERGFAGTGREDIAERAGVTRGALYHHFATKEDLFRAVFEEVEGDLVGRVAAAAMSGGGAADRLRTGCHAFLDAAVEPDVLRIVLLDAPSVLGWQTWRELDARFGLGLVQAGLVAAMDEGAIATQPVEPLAHMLLAALNEAAMLVGSAPDPAATRTAVGLVVDHLLERL